MKTNKSLERICYVLITGLYVFMFCKNVVPLYLDPFNEFVFDFSLDLMSLSYMANFVCFQVWYWKSDIVNLRWFIFAAINTIFVPITAFMGWSGIMFLIFSFSEAPLNCLLFILPIGLSGLFGYILLSLPFIIATGGIDLIDLMLTEQNDENGLVKYCDSCGQDLEEKDAYCSACGTKQ